MNRIPKSFFPQGLKKHLPNVGAHFSPGNKATSLTVTELSNCDLHLTDVHKLRPLAQCTGLKSGGEIRSK